MINFLPIGGDLSRLFRLRRRLSRWYQKKIKKVFISTDIETYGICNRKCLWCFNNERFPRREVGIMADKVWYKIINDLTDINYAGRISPFFYGEPLLDKRLPDLVEYARRKCPYSHIRINSNGDFLDEAILVKLISSGTDSFLVTNYENNYNEKLEYLADKYSTYLQVRRADDFRKSNVGGMDQTVNPIVKRPCYRPSEQLVVNWRGDVLLCCGDYYAKHKFGNVMDNNIVEIWFSPELQNYRKILLAGDRQMVDICRQCDL